MGTFNLDPDPKILVSLTHTAMKPIDALCELVDNAIDSFENTGGKSEHVNEINIILPTLGDLKKNEESRPFITVSDNGPGMTPDEAQKALTAGYSGKDRYGSLGLFGVGLNIATGKFARKTRLITATKESQEALVVDLDLIEIVKQRNFEVQHDTKDKSDYFEKDGSGTIIQLSGRWAEGQQNHDFPKKLIQNGPGQIITMLGRRYSSLLRGDSGPKFSIFVNSKKCTPFEHCAWSKKRSVKHNRRDIFAREEFNKLLGSSEICMECGTIIEDGKCAADESHSGIYIIKRWVRGWIGVQRFDSQTRFGIDLIRKGRSIRIDEKEAFFTFKNDSGEETKDYPIDGIFGRIIGEVYLDHVPVNFTKEDFDRTTPEWSEALEFLRGNSSLQPNQPGAQSNDSPLMKIYTGYRRVRKLGTADLYMAKWQDGKLVRIGRVTENSFFEKFLKKEEGYYDDTKWFDHVILEPEDGYIDCLNPDCDGQNSADAEICQMCRFLLKSKKCVNAKCAKDIQQSESVCQHCGYSQEPEGPWKCAVCEHSGNHPDMLECRQCSSLRGAINQFDEQRLMENSSPDDSLSGTIEIEIPGEVKSEKVFLEVRNASLKSGSIHIPAVVFDKTDEQKSLLFLDRNHPAFSLLNPYYAVAEVAADSVYKLSTSVKQGPRKHEHNLVILTCKILEKYWGHELVDDSDKVRSDIDNFWDDVREKMVENFCEISVEIFDAMSNSQVKGMMAAMVDGKVDMGGMKLLKESGAFMRYIPPDAIVAVFNEYTSRFFERGVWNSVWDIPEVSEEVAADMQEQMKKTHLNCLEDCISFGRYKNPPLLLVRRVRLSLQVLEKDLTE